MRNDLRGKLSDELVDELLAGASSEEEIVGPAAGQLTRLVERAMEVELTDHLGYERPPGDARGTGQALGSTERPREQAPGLGRVPLSRRSSESAGGRLRASTRRSSRSTAAGFRSGTGRRMRGRSTGWRSRRG